MNTLKSWIQVFFIGFFISITAYLFVNEHYVWGTILTVVGISICENYYSKWTSKELGWISRCLMDDGERAECKESQELYYLAKRYIGDGKIKNGMTLKEVSKLLSETYSKVYGKGKSIKTTFLKQTVDGFYDDTTRDKFTLVYGDYGSGIPTQEIHLEFNNDRLVKIKG